ncbi:MAG TPA: cytochrome c oxidase assembly protein [Acidothermaceae bacterium]
MSVDWARVLTRWQTDGVSVFGIALEVAVVAAYCYGVARVRSNGRTWPAFRTFSFVLGVASLALVLQSGFAAYDDDLLWVHMTQHLVLMMVAAPLFALGAPVRLCFAAGSGSVRRFVAEVLHDPSMRLVTGTAAAVLLPLDYFGSMAVYLLTPLYRLSEVNQGFHEFVHVYFLACGLMFWVPMLGQGPVAWRPTLQLKLALVSAGVPIYIAISAAMFAEGSFMSPAHSLADIHRGAVAMLVGGVVLTLAGDALVLWCERRRTSAIRQRASDRLVLVSTS